MTAGRRSDPDRHDLGVERQVRGSVPNWLTMNQDWRDHTRRRWWEPLVGVVVTLTVLGVLMGVAGCASDDDGLTAPSGTTTSEAAPAPSSVAVVWDAPLTAPPPREAGQAPILLTLAGPVGDPAEGTGRRWVQVAVYRDGSAVRIDGGTADPWASASARRLVDGGATQVVESVTVGYLRIDPAELEAAIATLPSGDGDVIGGLAVSDTANTEMVLYGEDGTGVAAWDLYALGLERDATGTLDAALSVEQGAAREAVSAFGRLLDDAFVPVTGVPADRLEVWAPYAITDVAVHWPGPPVTEVVGDQGCGVVEGVDAETIRAYLGDGNTITDDPGLVVLALLAPQEEACIVRQ